MKGNALDYEIMAIHMKVDCASLIPSPPPSDGLGTRLVSPLHSDIKVWP